jgi:phosphoribosylglycinamide formyltransferase-1
MTATKALRVVVLASGSGTNLQAIMDAIKNGQLAIDIAAVISDRPQAYALTRASQANIPTITIDYKACNNRSDYDRRLQTALADVQPDLIVLAGYMRILASATVNDYLGQMLNIHPSLLPAYPGLNTYQRAMDAGEQWHGTTVHFVIPELDAGPAIIQYQVKINTGDTEPELRDRVQQGEYEIYPRAINWFALGRVKFSDGQTWFDNKLLARPVVINEPR